MRYIIPAGTPVLTAPDARQRSWTSHTTRRTLLFATYRLKDASEFTFAYHGRLLRVPRAAVQKRPDDGTVLYSLIFSLVADALAMRDLVVQLDEHAEGQYMTPADPKRTLLDVGPGDGLLHQGRCETVKGVQSYRTSAIVIAHEE
jgi:hypothetical protein